MRAIFAFGFLFLITSSALCQTHITMDQVWSGDTINVSQNVVIDSGVKLTINPGTIVVFLEGNYIDVYGTLEINGTATDSVIMTAPQTNWIEMNSDRKYYGWGGIYTYGNGIVNAKYTIFEKLGYSTQPKSYESVEGLILNASRNAMTFENCSFSLKRNLLQSSDGCRIEGDKALIIIKGCVFKNNKGSGSLVNIKNSGSLQISNTSFTNNDLKGNLVSVVTGSCRMDSCRYEGNKAGGLLDVMTFNGQTFVENNVFRKNIGSIQLQSIYSSAYFRNNTYSDNGGQVYFNLGTNVIAGNVFLRNYYADPYNFFFNDYQGILRIESQDLTNLIVLNNSFINNRDIALGIFMKGIHSIENNIFHNNYPADFSFNIDLQSLNTNGRNFQYNLLNQTIPGAGNKSGDPRIMNTQEGFIVGANSPVIDCGTSTNAGFLLNYDVIGNPRVKGIIDIGAVEFTDSYVPLIDVNISDTVIRQLNAGYEVAQFTTTSQFGTNEISYSLSNSNGMNNDFFTLVGNKLLLKEELTTEEMLRIKIRVEHISGAWLEKAYYLTVASSVVGLERASLSELLIYPVPANKFLKINKIEPNTSYTILSASGVKFETKLLSEETIDISGLVEGIYILQLVIDNKVKVIKFYKQGQ